MILPGVFLGHQRYTIIILYHLPEDFWSFSLDSCRPSPLVFHPSHMRRGCSQWLAVPLHSAPGDAMVVAALVATTKSSPPSLQQLSRTTASHISHILHPYFRVSEIVEIQCNNERDTGCQYFGCIIGRIYLRHYGRGRVGGCMQQWTIGRYRYCWWKTLKNYWIRIRFGRCPCRNQQHTQQ